MRSIRRAVSRLSSTTSARGARRQRGDGDGWRRREVGRVEAGRRLLGGRLLVDGPRPREDHGDAGALAGRRVHADAPAHEVEQPLGDGQAEAGALVLAGVAVGLLSEGAKEVGQEGGVDPDARVAHVQEDAVGIGLDADRDPPAGGELDRVREEVQQHAVQRRRVHHGAGGLGRLHIQGEALLVGHDLEQVRGLAGGAVDLDGAGVDFHLAALDLCQVEDGVQRLVQAVRTAPERGHHLAPLCRVERVVLVFEEVQEAGQ
jgi:hypothetical protein